MRIALREPVSPKMLLAYAKQLVEERHSGKPTPSKAKIQRESKELAAVAARELQIATIRSVGELLGERFFACVRHGDARTIGTRLRVDMLGGSIQFQIKERNRG